MQTSQTNNSIVNQNSVVETNKKSTVKTNSAVRRGKTNDECYTPDYGVTPLLQYVPKDKTIWFPCDTEDSQYVKIFKENGYEVIHSHIWEGKDFFAYEPKEHYDIVIVNPAFSKKYEFLRRLLDLGKPFACLLPDTIIADGKLYTIFDNYDKELQLLLLDRRMEFDRPNAPKKKKKSSISFKAIYFCHNFLPKQMIMAELPKPNSRRDKVRTDLTFHYNAEEANNTTYNKEEGVA